MFERFTDRARRVMALSHKAAQKHFHERIGTEHVLIGLLDEEHGVAGNVIRHLELDQGLIRRSFSQMFPDGPEMVTMGRYLHTPNAKKLIDKSIEIARDWDHNYVGTEHLLLAMSKMYECGGAKLLAQCRDGDSGLVATLIDDEMKSLLTSGSKDRAYSERKLDPKATNELVVHTDSPENIILIDLPSESMWQGYVTKKGEFALTPVSPGARKKLLEIAQKCQRQ